MERRRGLAYLVLLLVFALLCVGVAFRLLRPDTGHGAMPSPGLLAIVAFAAFKCGYDLMDKRLDRERRLLSVAALVPVALFLLSFYVSASLSLGLLVLAAVTLLVASGTAFLAGQKLRAP